MVRKHVNNASSDLLFHLFHVQTLYCLLVSWLLLMGTAGARCVESEEEAVVVESKKGTRKQWLLCANFKPRQTLNWITLDSHLTKYNAQTYCNLWNTLGNHFERGSEQSRDVTCSVTCAQLNLTFTTHCITRIETTTTVDPRKDQQEL